MIIYPATLHLLSLNKNQNQTNMIVYTLLTLALIAGSAFAGYYFTNSLNQIFLTERDGIIAEKEGIIKALQSHIASLESDIKMLSENLEAHKQLAKTVKQAPVKKKAPVKKNRKINGRQRI